MVLWKKFIKTHPTYKGVGRTDVVYGFSLGERGHRIREAQFHAPTSVTSSSPLPWPEAMLENDHESGLATVQSLHFASHAEIFSSQAPPGVGLYSIIIQSQPTAKKDTGLCFSTIVNDIVELIFTIL